MGEIRSATPLPTDARVVGHSVTPARRARLSARFPGERLIIPAGELKVRSNDCDYRFRPHSAVVTGKHWSVGGQAW